MKKIIIKIIVRMIRAVFWLRYRIKVKGLENINQSTLKKSGGVLFLPNHPTLFIDPTILSTILWSKFPIRPMITDDFYYMPIIHSLMIFIKALPIPNYDVSNNSLKRKKGEKIVQTVIKDLEAGDNFLIYPAGRIKQTSKEIIGGASAIHRVIEGAPNANIVLVRIKGLWGSSFSRAITGKSPSLTETLKLNFVHLLKNLIFFTPRREVVIEFEMAPQDFPLHASRLELNHWLEDWYNKPDGLTIQKGELPGDSLIFVSYSMWRNDVPKSYQDSLPELDTFDLDSISSKVRVKVYQEISRITGLPEEEIRPNANFNLDYGMDSLDVSELSSFIQHNFDVQFVPVAELTTVGRALEIADLKVVCKEKGKVAAVIDFNKWNQKIPRKKQGIAHGNTIPEVFLNNCARMGDSIACGDEVSGLVNYRDLKMRVILLANYIRKLPGSYIGILLPSSVAAYAVILACELAGKVPMLINWTMGTRHLEAIKMLSDVKVVLTSWAFIDRLDNIDLRIIEDTLIMLEDVRKTFTLSDKVSAYLLSKKSTYLVMKHFHIDRLSKNDQAVLLFTSGTESLPKGVPLSHENILSNLKQTFDTLEVFTDDVLFGILPPFHAFGFTISGLLGLLSGNKIVYTPNPMDGQKLANIVMNWRVSIMCGAPTFLKSMLKAGSPNHFKTLKLCVTGAEKAPPELFTLAEQMGCRQSIFEGYGITECSPVLTMNRPGKAPAGVGEPLNGVELLIVHPDTYQPLGGLERGLVLASGSNVFSHYINPDETSPFIHINGKKWFKTGDLGYIDDENRLILSGRKKRFVKIGGEMISLTAIEDALLQQAFTRGWTIAEEGPTLAVCAKESLDTKTKIVLFSIFETTVDEVNGALRDAGFSNLVKVSFVIKLNTIPIMGSGKIFYRELENITIQSIEK